MHKSQNSKALCSALESSVKKTIRLICDSRSKKAYGERIVFSKLIVFSNVISSSSKVINNLSGRAPTIKKIRCYNN